MEMENNNFMTPEEVANFLNLKNRKTVDNMLYSGTLPRCLTVKLGRNVLFFRDKLIKYLEKTSVEQTLNLS